MKLSPVVALVSAATTLRCGPALAWSTPTVSHRTTTRFSSSSLKSTVTPDEAVLSPALEPMGTPVAEGTVVSLFRGGLAAVQVADGGGDANNKKEESPSSQANDLMGRQVVFGDGSVGMVVAQRPPILFVYTNNSELMEDGTVQVLDSMAQVEVSPNMGGSVLDAFGRPAATGSPSYKRDIFADIPQVKDISLINTPMLTGITMVDALAPIGRGQNMLWIGSDIEEKRGYVAEFLGTQIQSGDTTCIYAVTHDKKEALEQLRKANLLQDVIVVACRDEGDNGGSPMDDPVMHAADATAVAATACAIAESFALNEGKHTLVVVDTIDAQKTLWDATTRTLVDVFGVDAVVEDDRNGGASSEMRAFYSSLIQRAGQFRPSNGGGGSVTLALLTTIPGDTVSASDETTVFDVSDFDDCSDKIKARLDILVKKDIPLTAAHLKKIEIPIPSLSEGQRRLILQHVDDLISMSDGQIWLDDSLAKEGQLPPMDPQRSITRVGIGADTASRADAPAIRRVVEGLRLDLAQAANLDGAEDTVASAKQKRKRNAWLLAMHQRPGASSGRSLSDSCVSLLAASIGALDDTIDAGGLAGTEQGQKIINDLLLYVQTVAPKAINEIDETLDIGPARQEELVQAIKSFFS